MQKNIFITGISTEVGKTIAAAIATEALFADYWKPVQSGELDNSDTLKVKRLVANTSSRFHPESYRLNEPLSPHASAEIDGIQIDVDKINRPITQNRHLIIEGAGGLLVPLNAQNTIADLIAPDDWTILVSKHYLGSINHTLLSYEYLKTKGIDKIAIWFNGNPNPSTEQIIKHKTEAFFIERIDSLSTLSPSTISEQARKITESLSAFLDWNGL